MRPSGHTRPSALVSRSSESGKPSQPLEPTGWTSDAAGTWEDVPRDNGEHVVTDDLELLLDSLPASITEPLRSVGRRANLLEVIMDLGRKPEARFRDGENFLKDTEVTHEDLQYVTERIGEFGGDNRAGIERTLHRISCIRNRRGQVVGLTCRIGRAVYGTISIIKDLVETGKSILLVGPPGVGKTTILRECARVLADEMGKRVVIVDTSNEIAGDGDIPHPSIGRARRMQVPVPERQHAVMIEAVENHMPEVIIIDEIGTELEAQAARTIAERGVQLVGTAHGTSLENLMLNPTLSDLVGGIQTVTLGDDEARRRGTQKSVLERKAPPTFDIMIELLDRERVAVHHDVSEMVDALLRGEMMPPEIRTRLADGSIHTEIPRTPPNRPGSTSLAPAGMGMNGRREGGRRGYEERQGYGSPNAPRRQLPSTAPRSPSMRRQAPTPITGLAPERIANRGPSGGYEAAQEANTGEMERRASIYDEAEEEQSPRLGAGAMSIASHASSQKPLRVYPFGVSRDRLENAIRQMRVPATLVRDFSDADVVMTLKNYYRKSGQTLRQAEASGVPVFVLKSNTGAQIGSALANIFDVALPSDPVTVAMEETETAISSVMETDRAVDLAPQVAPIRKIQHQMAERYNLQSVSRGKEPFRHVRIFRQD
jgi:stage III sporulation protein SpoIIIAA